MTFTVKIGPDDIRHGKRGCCWACPIARAANRAAAPHGLYSASVGMECLRFAASPWVDLPPEAVAWIEDFDANRNPPPISFPITVPDRAAYQAT